MDNFLIPFFSILFSIAFYPPLMLLLGFVLGLGIFTWLFFGLMLSPYAAVWYYLVTKRERIQGKSVQVDISRTLDEYEQMIKSS